MSNKWIRELKRGDKVFVSSYGSVKLYKVERITAKGFIKVNDNYYGKTGCLIGGEMYKTNHLEQATEDKLKDYENKAFIYDVTKEIRRTRYNTLTYEQAFKIAEILNLNIKK